MRHFQLGLLILALSLTMMGCASNGQPGFRTGLLIEPLDAEAVGYTINWSTHLKVPSNQQLTAVEVLDDLIVTVEAPRSTVSAVSLRNGELLWRRVIGLPTERLFAPVRAGDRIFVNSAGRIFTLNAKTGDLLGVAELDEPVSASGVLVNNVIVFGGTNGRVFGHGIDTSFARWRYQLTSEIVARPTAVGFNVLAADNSGIYALLNSDDGTVVWRGRTFGPVTASSEVDRLAVYVPSHDQSLYALDRATGRDRWIYRTTQPLNYAPKAAGLTIYLPLGQNGLVALNSVDGQEKWRLDAAAIPVTVKDEQTMLLATKKSLKLVNVDTGRILVDSPTLELGTVLEGPDNSVVLVSPAGRLLRLNPRP